jgi:hypothetical protein
MLSSLIDLIILGRKSLLETPSLQIPKVHESNGVPSGTTKTSRLYLETTAKLSAENSEKKRQKAIMKYLEATNR